MCPYHSRPPLWKILFSSNAHLLSYTKYIMCKLFIIHWVNENSSILSLFLLLSQFISANVCVIFYLDIFCTGSKHLHDIIFNKLLRKSYTKLFLQVPKIEDNEKMEFPKEFILTLYNYFAWKERIIMHLRTRGLYRLTLNTKT